MKFKNDMDYVIYFSESMKNNPALFMQQKKFIDSQFESSKSLFDNWKGGHFKEKCRKYLKERGVI